MNLEESDLSFDLSPHTDDMLSLEKRLYLTIHSLCMNNVSGEGLLLGAPLPQLE